MLWGIVVEEEDFDALNAAQPTIIGDKERRVYGNRVMASKDLT